MNRRLIECILLLGLVFTSSAFAGSIPGTGQIKCYDDSQETTCPQSGEPFDGQDAQYEGIQPGYVDNGDGTVTDLNTGLMWQQDPGSSKMSWDEADAGAASFNLAGYTDWRLPTIKELYSLILFSGLDVSICMGPESGSCSYVPFIDTDYFEFEYGDESVERIIDAQYASSTKYVSTTMDGDETAFGVNFADGRIKGYGLWDPGTRQDKTFFVMYVRGNTDYGINNFVDNGDGTVTDLATGLMWMQKDSGHLSAGSVGGDVGSENNLTKYTIHPKVIPCLDNQDLMLPEHYIMLWAGE